MNYSQNPTQSVNGYKTPEWLEKKLEFDYYKQRTFTDRSIKLHREHIPINPKVCINNIRKKRKNSRVEDCYLRRHTSL